MWRVVKKENSSLISSLYVIANRGITFLYDDSRFLLSTLWFQRERERERATANPVLLAKNCVERSQREDDHLCHGESRVLHCGFQTLSEQPNSIWFIWNPSRNQIPAENSINNGGNGFHEFSITNYNKTITNTVFERLGASRVVICVTPRTPP